MRYVICIHGLDKVSIRTSGSADCNNVSLTQPKIFKCTVAAALRLIKTVNIYAACLVHYVKVAVIGIRDICNRTCKFVIYRTAFGSRYEICNRNGFNLRRFLVGVALLNHINLRILCKFISDSERNDSRPLGRYRTVCIEIVCNFYRHCLVACSIIRGNLYPFRSHSNPLACRQNRYCLCRSLDSGKVHA